MITGLEIHNIFSINDTKVSFFKSKYQYLQELVMNDKIANPIAIYGSNGSGKSSFLESFDQLVNLLTGNIDEISTFMPNLSNKNSLRRQSYMKLDFEINDKEYSYFIRTNYQRILEEYLTIDGNKVLERNKDQYKVNDRTIEITSGMYSALRDYVTKVNNKDDIYDVYEYLSNIAYIGAERKIYRIKAFNNNPYRDVIVKKSKDVKKILSTYKNFPLYEVEEHTIQETNSKIYVADIETNGKKISLLYDLISEGMKSQSFLLTALLSIPENGVLIIDELEDALHPLIIKSFIDVAIKKNIQLIFTSHNTNTLSQLRPDNIIFANWKNGESSYKRLSDIYPNIREVNNIEKMYLSSTFDEEIEK